MGPAVLILLGLAKVAAVVTAVKVSKQPKRVDKPEKETGRQKKQSP